MSHHPGKEEIVEEYTAIQELICHQIAEIDGKGSFIKDKWQRDEGGGGLSRVLADGKVLEKAGVNFSAVYGNLNDAMKRSLNIEDASSFFATGVSIVMHPNNPNIPIIHMNIRYFEVDTGTYWFGGGIDLTPHYIDRSEAQKFHSALKGACDKFDKQYYPEFKKYADDYFFIPHRNETRGIGGIFYDHLAEDPAHSKRSILDFSLEIGKLFPKIYGELINANRHKSFGENELKWQMLRRGRYVEFNLVYDRGTRFGLLSNGRTESILMSLPRNASWVYDYHAEAGSREEETLSLLKKGVDWIR